MQNSRSITRISLSDLIEVTLAEPDDFLKVKETLTRIGVLSRKDHILWQSCHILHKKGRYYILGFKELFALDGRPTNLSENDIARRNTIANLLDEWGLVALVNPEKSAELTAPLSQIKIIPHKDKDLWALKVKYTIGKQLR